MASKIEADPVPRNQQARTKCEALWVNRNTESVEFQELIGSVGQETEFSRKHPKQHCFFESAGEKKEQKWQKRRCKNDLRVAEQRLLEPVSGELHQPDANKELKKQKPEFSKINADTRRLLDHQVMYQPNCR